MHKASANSKMAGFLLIALIGSACILWIAFSGIGEIITSLQSLEIDDEKKSALIKLVNANNVWSLIFGGVIISGIVLFILFQYRPLLKGINNTIEILDNPKQTQVIENLKLASTQAGHSAIRHTQQLLTNHLEDVQQRISNVNDTVSGCSETTAQLSTDVTQVANSVNDQNQELEQIATAINQMSATIHEVARNMSKAADAASKLKKDAQSGAVQATAAIGAIANLDQQVNSNADIIDEVHTETTNINVLIDVINGIADQTNLLALNAAIEAARAGEQGRGFAVVADEVRVLATRTSESTQEIETMLTSLLTKSSAAVESMQKAKGQAEHSGNSVEDAAAALANISGEIKNIDEMNLQVASAMEEQSVVAEEINQKVQNISNLTNHVDLDIKKISEASEKLLEQVTHFKKLVS